MKRRLVRGRGREEKKERKGAHRRRENQHKKWTVQVYMEEVCMLNTFVCDIIKIYHSKINRIMFNAEKSTLRQSVLVINVRNKDLLEGD